MDEYRNLTDREILILLRNDFRNEVANREATQEVTDKRLDAHARDIRDLRAFRYWAAGGLAALAAYFKFGNHGG